MSKKIVQTALVGAFIGFFGISEGNAGEKEDFADFQRNLCGGAINGQCGSLWLNLNIKSYQPYKLEQFKKLCDEITAFCNTVKPRH